MTCPTQSPIQPAPINRSSDGFWTHPNFPDFGEYIDPKALDEWEDQNNIIMKKLWFENDASEELHDRYYEQNDLKAVADWHPEMEGAYLLSIHDTEDGPVALFAAPTHENTEALKSVIREMVRQDKKWGTCRNQHPFVWQTILTEEVGELAEAALHKEFGGPAANNLRNEAVQVAAVALQLIEQIDRLAQQKPQVET